MDVTNDQARHRYTVEVDGATAFASYRRDGDTIVFTHTIVPEALRGRGIGSALVQGALADVRHRGEQIVAECPFVADYLARHPEEQDLRA